MSDENASPAAAPAKSVLRIAPNKKRGTKPIKLAEGLFAHARALDAFEHAQTISEAKADLNAMLAGGVPRYAWEFEVEELQNLQGNEDLRAITVGWMRNVLTATMSVERFDDGKGGAPGLVLDVYAEDGETLLRTEELPPSFKAFRLLFRDSVVEMSFRVAAFETERFWSAEKNVSAPVLSGHGRADLSSAQDAASMETLAAEEGKESSLMAGVAAVQSAETHHTPPSGMPAGESPAQAPVGAAAG